MTGLSRYGIPWALPPYSHFRDGSLRLSTWGVQRWRMLEKIDVAVARVERTLARLR